jgi:dihydrofolate reductase
MLLEHGLADEVLLFVYPILLGKGKRFFSDGTPPSGLSLASTNAVSSGVLINAYTLPDICVPSPRRRERMPKF